MHTMHACAWVKGVNVDRRSETQQRFESDFPFFDAMTEGCACMLSFQSLSFSDHFALPIPSLRTWRALAGDRARGRNVVHVVSNIGTWPLHFEDTRHTSRYQASVEGFVVEARR